MNEQRINYRQAFAKKAQANADYPRVRQPQQTRRPLSPQPQTRAQQQPSSQKKHNSLIIDEYFPLNTNKKTLASLNLLNDQGIAIAYKRTRASEIFYKVFMVLIALIIAVALGFLANYFLERQMAEANYQEMAEAFTTQKKESVPAQIDPNGDVAKDPNVFPPLVNFAGLQSINSEVNGWIYAPNTPINYPIVYSPVSDKYLRMDIYGNYSVAGTVFQEHTSPTGDLDKTEHVVLYGHHLNSGNMFSPIHEMREKSYRDAHRLAWLISPTTVYKLSLVGVYTVEPTEVHAAEATFDGHMDFQKYLDERLSRIKEPYEFNRKTINKLVTLITCTNNGKNREIAEYVVVEQYPTSHIKNVIEAPESSIKVDAG